MRWLEYCTSDPADVHMCGVILGGEGRSCGGEKDELRRRQRGRAGGMLALLYLR